MIQVATADGIDVEDLYGVFASELEVAVGRRVTAPAAAIEDACQLAWGQLWRHRHRVTPAAAPGWLTTTAVREVARLLWRQRLEQALLVDEDDEDPLRDLPAGNPEPELVVERRLLIAEVERLPVRQQRVVWLRGFGYAYDEIAERTGDTPRTVERQLLRARRSLRTAAA